MEIEDLDPESFEKAKKLCKGPLGAEMCKFPLRFAKAALIGIRPIDDSPNLCNGTVSLVDFGNGPKAITCFHVLAEYKKRKAENKNTIFQIGNVEVDVLNNIIDEDENLDLAIINLKAEDVSAITNGDVIGSCFYQPTSWPPGEVKKGDSLAFGGFPGLMRELESKNEVVFRSWSSGASLVEAVNDDYIVCQFERVHWVKPDGMEAKGEDLHDLGGLSGAPVFIWRNVHYEFVGIVYQFSSEYDLMRIRPTKFIRTDGTIDRM